MLDSFLPRQGAIIFDTAVAGSHILGLILVVAAEDTIVVLLLKQRY